MKTAVNEAVAAIVILSHSQSPWLYAWHRYLETFLGIGVALLVNNFIFPARAGTELRRYLSQTLVHLEQSYQSHLALPDIEVALAKSTVREASCWRSLS